GPGCDQHRGGPAVHDRGRGLLLVPPGRHHRASGGAGVAAVTRLEELRTNLAAVRERIDAAARAADRDPADIRLLPVTKFHPASDLELLLELGVTDVAENREQEARAKAADVP